MPPSTSTSAKRGYQLVIEVPTRAALAQASTAKRPRIAFASSPPPSPNSSTTSTDSLQSFTSSTSASTAFTFASSVAPIPTAEGAEIGLVPFSEPSSPLNQLAVAATFVATDDSAVEIMPDGTGRLVQTGNDTPVDSRRDIKPDIAELGHRDAENVREDDDLDIGEHHVPPEMREQDNLADALVDFVELLNDALPADEGDVAEIELERQQGQEVQAQLVAEQEMYVPGTTATEVVDGNFDAPAVPLHPEDDIQIHIEIASSSVPPSQELAGIPEDHTMEGEAPAASEERNTESQPTADEEEQSCGICYGDIADVLKDAEDAGKGGIGGGLALWVCEQPNCGMLFCITCAVAWANRAIDQRNIPTCSQCTRPTDIEGLRKQVFAYDPTTPNPIHEPPPPPPPRNGQLEQFARIVYAEFRTQRNYQRVRGTAAGQATWRDFFIDRMAVRIPARHRAEWHPQLLIMANSPVILGLYLEDVRQNVPPRQPNGANPQANDPPFQLGPDPQPHLDGVNRQREDLRIQFQRRNLAGHPGVNANVVVQDQAAARRAFNAQPRPGGVRDPQFAPFLQHFEAHQAAIAPEVLGLHHGAEGVQPRHGIPPLTAVEMAEELLAAVNRLPAVRRQQGAGRPLLDVALAPPHPIQLRGREGGVNIRMMRPRARMVHLANAGEGVAIPPQPRGVRIAEPVNVVPGPRGANAAPLGQRLHEAVRRIAPRNLMHPLQLPARRQRGQ